MFMCLQRQSTVWISQCVSMTGVEQMSKQTVFTDRHVEGAYAFLLVQSKATKSVYRLETRKCEEQWLVLYCLHTVSLSLILAKGGTD